MIINKHHGYLGKLATLSLIVIAMIMVSGQIFAQGSTHKDHRSGSEHKMGSHKDKGDIYSLDTCPVSGMKLGSMGDPVIYDFPTPKYISQAVADASFSGRNYYVNSLGAPELREEISKSLNNSYNVDVKVDDILDSFVYIINNGMIGNNCKGILTDLRECALNFEMNDFKNLLEYIKASPSLKDLKIAVVVDSSKNIVFPMMASNQTGIKVQPFSTIDAATEWILQ